MQSTVTIWTWTYASMLFTMVFFFAIYLIQGAKYRHLRSDFKDLGDRLMQSDNRNENLKASNARLRKENFHLGKSSDEQGELIDRLTTKAPGTMVTLPSLDVRHVSAAMRQIFYNYFPYEPVKFDPNLEEFNELRRRVSNSVIRCTNNDGDKFCRVPVSCFLDWLEGFEPVATLNHEAKAPMSLHEEG